MSGKISVNVNQKGNPILDLIKNQGWQHADIIPDYLVGKSNALLYLRWIVLTSLKYYRLHPEYIGTRLYTIRSFNVRILLVLVDISANQSAIRELTQQSLDSNVTMILAWSESDVAKYIETFKQYEFKPADVLRERIDDDPFSKLTNFLTQIKSLNKTDVVTLTSNFATLKDIMLAKPDDLRELPGFGEDKVKRLQKAFTTNFMISKD